MLLAKILNFISHNKVDIKMTMNYQQFVIMFQLRLYELGNTQLGYALAKLNFRNWSFY